MFLMVDDREKRMVARWLLYSDICGGYRERAGVDGRDDDGRSAAP